jgi:hypothetical protein
MDAAGRLVVNGIYVAQEKEQWRASSRTALKLCVPLQARNFFQRILAMAYSIRVTRFSEFSHCLIFNQKTLSEIGNLSLLMWDGGDTQNCCAVEIEKRSLCWT